MNGVIPPREGLFVAEGGEGEGEGGGGGGREEDEEEKEGVVIV